jgi:hypothetical protein
MTIPTNHSQASSTNGDAGKWISRLVPSQSGGFFVWPLTRPPPPIVETAAHEMRRQAVNQKENPAQRVTAVRAKRENLNMHDLRKCATNFNRDFSRGRCKAIWSADILINRRDVLRVELLTESNGRSTVDFRRWNGEKPSKRGLAFDIRHLPSAAALLNEALGQARATGQLPDGGVDV